MPAQLFEYRRQRVTRFISLGLFMMAAMLNASMDAFENENFFESVFSNLDQTFWYKRESWQHATRIFGWKFDSWHVAKSLMIICICGSVVTYRQVLRYRWLDFVLFGVTWNIIFWLFYHAIFGVR